MLNRASQLFCVFLVAAASSSAASESFQVPPPSSYAPLPEPITSFGAVTHDGWLYVYGGHMGERHMYAAADASSAFRRLNLTDGITWENLPPDVPAQSPVFAANGNFIYRVGGMAARNPRGEKQDLWSHDTAARFNLESGQWEQLPRLPKARSSHDGWIVNDKLYVMGGWTLAGDSGNAEWANTMLVLDLDKRSPKWKEIPQPFKRRGLSVMALGDDLYCIGGMDDYDSTSLEVDVFNTRTGKWSDGPSLPYGRLKGFGNSACVVDDRFYVSGMSGVVYRLNEARDGWEELKSLRTPRFFHRLVPGGEGQLLALGGEGEAGKLREIEVVSIDQSDSAVWNSFRGPKRDGVIAAEFNTESWPADGPPVLWKASVGAGVCSFAATEDRVFTAGTENDTDTIWCLNAKDGSVVWKFDYPCASKSHQMPAVPGGPAATPTLAGGRLFTLSREGDLFCLDAATGKLVWQKSLLKDLNGKRPVYGYSNSPLVTDGVVFLDVGGEKGSTVALNAETGKLLWSAGSGEAGYSSPRLTMLNDRPALAMFKGEAFELMNPHDGKLLARWETTSRDYCNTIMPVVSSSYALVSNTGNDGTACLDFRADNASMLWTNKALGFLFCSPVLWQGRIIGFEDINRNDNTLHCVDALTGEAQWAFEEVPKGAFIIAGGRMIVLTRSGELVVIEPKAGAPEVLARSQVLGGRSYAEPVLAGGRIFCRNNDGQVVCLDARPEEHDSQVAARGNN